VASLIVDAVRRHVPDHKQTFAKVCLWPPAATLSVAFMRLECDDCFSRDQLVNRLRSTPLQSLASPR